MVHTRAQRARQASVCLILLGLLSGCLYDFDDYGDGDGVYDDPGFEETPLIVEGGEFTGVMGDVRIDAASTFRVEQSSKNPYYATIDLRSQNRDGFAMAMLTFNDGLDVNSLVPGMTFGTETDAYGYTYSSVSLMACSGPEDENWLYDVSGNATVTVEPSELDGFVRLVFEAELPTYDSSETETETILGTVDIALE